MLSLNKIVVITLLATFATAIKCEENSSKYEMLTQLKSQDIQGSTNDIYIYICNVGSKHTAESGNSVSCSSSDSEKWSAPHDVQMVMRCPKHGTGDRMTFAEIKFSSTSPDIKCEVTDGGIGMNHLALTLNIWKTTKLDYSAKFYTN